MRRTLIIEFGRDKPGPVQGQGVHEEVREVVSTSWLNISWFRGSIFTRLHVWREALHAAGDALRRHKDRGE